MGFNSNVCSMYHLLYLLFMNLCVDSIISYLVSTFGYLLWKYNYFLNCPISYNLDKLNHGFWKFSLQKLLFYQQSYYLLKRNFHNFDFFFLHYHLDTKISNYSCQSIYLCSVPQFLFIVFSFFLRSRSSFTDVFSSQNKLLYTTKCFSFH